MSARPILRAGWFCRPAGNAQASCSLALRPWASATTRTFSSSARDAAQNTGSSTQANSSSSSSGSGSSGAIVSSVPPVSPHYIKVPTPPQSEEVIRPPRRGHLPVPRDIFNHRRSSVRPKEVGPDGQLRHPQADAAAWTAEAAPRSQAELRGEPPQNDREARRRRLADSRRTSLETGLRGLWTRQQARTERERARAQNVANRHRRAALYKPEDRDDVLTRGSVRASTANVTAVVRDPERHARQAASAERTAALAQRRRESRRDALMELYQAAGKFIVDEAELRQRVEELFRPDYFKEVGYSYGTVGAENIWDVMGKPASLNDMMSGITRTETKLYDSKRTEADRTTKRQKLVAEALTGGKMPL